jgi:spermidine synthase
LLGCYSVIAQAVILRESLVTFYGSELTLGLVLASWLLWVGAGSLAGVAAERLQGRASLPAVAAALQCAAAFLLPVSILLLRSMPGWGGAEPGEFPSLAATAGATFLVTAGPGFFSGAWFTAASLLPSPPGEGAGRAYTWEALGALLGGGVFTYGAVGILGGMEAAVVLAVVLGSEGFVSCRPRRFAFFPAAALLLAAAALLAAPRGEASLAAQTEALRWPGQRLLDADESPLGHLALLEHGGQKTLYASGVPAFHLPEDRGDTAVLHLALRLAGGTSVLLIGTGPGEALVETLRYPVERVDYLLADGAGLALLTPHLPGPVSDALADQRLKVVHDDARHWLRSRPGPYDAIIMDLPEPSTALFNRFYTRRFFGLARKALTTGGTFFVTMNVAPTSGDAGRERRNRSVYRALQGAFGEVAVVAGEAALLAARANGEAPSRQEIEEAAGDAPPVSEAARAEVLLSLVDAGRRDSLAASLRIPERENTDRRPAAYFYHFLHWGSLRDPAAARWLAMLSGRLRLAPLLLPLALLAAGGAGIAGGRRKSAPSLAACTTGLASMTLFGLLIFSYQTTQGQLYRNIGLLTAFFMAGTAGGGFSALAASSRGRDSLRLLTRAEALFFLWCPVLGAALAAAASWSLQGPPATAFYLVLAGACGFLTGFEFPLFVPSGGGAPGGRGGVYYALDLAGAAAGALLVFLWILPLLGVWAAILFAALAKLASLIICLALSRSTGSTA